MKSMEGLNRTSIPTRYQRLAKRAASGRSIKAAVKLHCIQCMGYSLKPAKVCEARVCPLWPYRPGTKRPSNGQIAVNNSRFLRKKPIRGEDRAVGRSD